MAVSYSTDFDWLTTSGSFIEQNSNDSTTLFAYLTGLREDWEKFMKYGKMDQTNYIRPEVLSSWKRAIGHNLSPYEPFPSNALSKKEFQIKLKENSDLIRIASPFLDALADNVAGSGFRIDLLDRGTVILKQFGDGEAMSFAANLGLKPGVCRSEKCTGTNAIGLAALLGRPIQLMGPEHFNELLHCWTCASSPIFDVGGNMLGLINMSGHYRMAHKHTLGMVIALAKAIEFSLQQNELRKEKERAARYLRNIVDSISDGVIATDRDGLIQFFNRTSAHILDIPVDEALGKNLGDIFHESSTIMRTLKQRERLIDKELVFSYMNKRKTMIGSSFPLNNQEDTEGFLTVYKELKNASHLVKYIAGFKAHFTFDEIKGKSKSFSSIVRLSQKAAVLPSNILLIGESGTGKELFAQAIHNASYFNKGPFVGISCAAIPATLIESELFGYEGGAFTGAKREGQTGKFQLAEGGTLFLDEINSMPISMQAKLLRVLQNLSYTRVGGTTEIPFTARLIAATNCDLWEEVKSNNFREDLFYRLNVITLEIPPLRDRLDDLDELIPYFCIKLAERLNFAFTISEKAKTLLAGYQWPGNIRELENVIERCAVCALSRNSSCIEEEDILSYKGIRDAHKNNSPATKLQGEENVTNLDSLEKIYIEKSLRQVEGNISKAAKLLGITRKTLYSKINKYKIKL